MGLETEYGILAPGQEGASSTALSAAVVGAYAHGLRGEPGLAATVWDYSDETPLQDARGWRLAREAAHASQLTDEPRELTAEEVALAAPQEGASTAAPPSNVLYDDALYRSSPHAPMTAAGRLGEHLGAEHVVMNMVLGNGARLYVDHAHPEYSSPEVTNPLDAVLWDQAGDAITLAAAERLAEHGHEVLLYKNNTDNKGVSYGAHENYLVPRDVEFGRLAAGLLPYFATRQVFCGSGRVGVGREGQTPGFQLSQRADFFEAQVGLETTVRRPLVNTRDEPHATWTRSRRLHVIAGDANLGQVSTYLRAGVTAVVLTLIEAGAEPAVELRDPVAAVAAISHDPTLRATVETVDGRRLTALDIQQLYLDAARSHDAARQDQCAASDPQTSDVLDRWQATLDGLRRDVFSQSATVDWVTKFHLMESYRQRHGLGYDDPRLAAMDLQWADLRPSTGLYRRLQARGRVEQLVSDDAIARAVQLPPSDTRAYVRGRTLSRYREHVVGANWDSLALAVPGRRGVQRVRLQDPDVGTADHLGDVFEREMELAEFVDTVAARLDAAAPPAARKGQP
ncbi:depupylase/deamidase Dop [Zhihengliuella flava]|nr:depupylase/deamidase Dop [Zhihengliuella flava]